MRKEKGKQTNTLFEYYVSLILNKYLFNLPCFSFLYRSVVDLAWSRMLVCFTLTFFSTFLFQLAKEKGHEIHIINYFLYFLSLEYLM